VKDRVKLSKLQTLKSKLEASGLTFKTFDFDRPWGGFLVVADKSKELFIDTFYPELKDELISTALPLSPKILCVSPNKRLSWQYHHRRAELWKLIDGQAAYIASETDKETDVVRMRKGKLLTLRCGERHRLIGREKWGIIAEIWQHVDTNKPSDEDDIVRLQDDFGR
jgi:mannose-6-phosphate isomerase